MGTNTDRARHERPGLRYPSDLTDEEQTLIGPVIPPVKRGGNTQAIGVHAVASGVVYRPGTRPAQRLRSSRSVACRTSAASATRMPKKGAPGRSGWLRRWQEHQINQDDVIAAISRVAPALRRAPYLRMCRSQRHRHRPHLLLSPLHRSHRHALASMLSPAPRPPSRRWCRWLL